MMAKGGSSDRTKLVCEVSARTLRRARVSLMAVAIAAVTSGTALAQKQPKVAPKEAAGQKDSRVDAARIKSELESGDETRILAALDELEKAGDAGKAGAPHVDTLLRRGANVRILTKALTASGALKQTSSSASIAPYVQHRAPEVRRAAVKALIKTKGPAAVKALRHALRSGDAVVRGTAATGLGTIGTKEALGDLFNALDHSVAEAAASIGQLCAADDCEKFAGRVGKIAFDVMTSGLDQILFRAPAEMPDDQKIRIVGRLRELGTKDAGKYLADVAERWPKEWSKRVKQALDAAVKASGTRGGEGG